MKREDILAKECGKCLPEQSSFTHSLIQKIPDFNLATQPSPRSPAPSSSPPSPPPPLLLLLPALPSKTNGPASFRGVMGPKSPNPPIAAAKAA
ncbi:hypothetical protein BAUCODRAFT_31818 [Baudoinia panamericana UAMH 10762]|uniref:Uncharacterized protein n=1 Tax=Baudoinia panamericana (strain UAMH 10762) TaxID=717646 RepID=M2NFN1_BAUPA|nr:uncharacterized protein BAUCODRAFT_31818 [Baudoinia panamericana UAMH 10762]EMC97815.1 hypothetical protein BAUCODRAFT_31818 [Baudoinia panamericana UAMH 10762]